MTSQQDVISQRNNLEQLNIQQNYMFENSERRLDNDIGMAALIKIMKR
jgi:hypothetical protein